MSSKCDVDLDDVYEGDAIDYHLLRESFETPG